MYQAIFTAARELFAESGVEETGEEFVLDVSIIHVAHARIQERLNCFAQLVHAQPDIVGRLLNTIPPDENEMVGVFQWQEHELFEDLVVLNATNLNCTDNYDVAEIKVISVTDHQ